ncbi:hypothetical protein C5167_015833 [Papaver somniferum]|uniref:Peptidase S59 domain-containing protein n=1 Tax=Papaver somniferum TaxID=3469 RepID=A0A4Y7JAC7_PAPSO|nr:hypothetical protein C5167_015833 [Papaver somniferum]
MSTRVIVVHRVGCWLFLLLRIRTNLEIQCTVLVVLIYKNSGISLLALAANAVHKLWKWRRNYRNTTGKATTYVQPQLWQPSSGTLMTNEISDAKPEDAIPFFAFSKNDSYVLSASGGKISLFNMMTFKQQTMTTFMPPPPAATFLATSRYCVYYLFQQNGFLLFCGFASAAYVSGGLIGVEKLNVLEIVWLNVQLTYITCLADPAATLGIKLLFLAILVKNSKKYFTFEIQVLDDKNVKRRFRNYVAIFHSTWICRSAEISYNSLMYATRFSFLLLCNLLFGAWSACRPLGVLGTGCVVAQVRVTSEEFTFYVADLAVSAELDLLIHYRDVLGNLFHEAYDAVQIDADTNYPVERAKDKLMKICDVFGPNLPLNIGPAEPWQKNLRIVTIFLCTRTRVIHPKGKWGCSRGSFQEHPKWDSYITLNGQRAGEAGILYEHGANIEALMPKLLHSDYYTEPRILELAAKERAEPGFCRRVQN